LKKNWAANKGGKRVQGRGAKGDRGNKISRSGTRKRVIMLHHARGEKKSINVQGDRFYSWGRATVERGALGRWMESFERWALAEKGSEKKVQLKRVPVKGGSRSPIVARWG